MDSVEEKVKTGVVVNATTQTNLLEEMKLLKEIHDHTGARKAINSELWHACAGPLVSLPQMGNLVYYFPQGHSEQVAVSTKRIATSQIPTYPHLSSQLMCQADKDTDEIYAQMCLQPVTSEKDVFPVPDFGLRQGKHPSEFFCKTLTASDTSTHGGFSVPRRAAEKLFPPLDFTMQPPTQELVVRDLHDNTWTFRHIYRGQPKRHLLTTGWSLFVGAKRLRAGDRVLFIRDEKSQLLVGVRRANRQPTTLPSSVLSADSMHLGVLAAAAHAAANHSPFTIFYNPRACPSEFVIPVAKYRKSVCGTQLSVGMRFGMMFETEESGKRRYMGTLVGISDLDPFRWPGSKWRNLQVEWDEAGCCDKQNRVSSWEIETQESLFIFPSLTSGLKRPLHNGYWGETDWGSLIKRPLLRVPENGHQNFPYAVSSLYSEQLMKMLVGPQLVNLPRSSSLPQVSVSKVDQLSNWKILQPVHIQKTNLISSESISLQNQTNPSSCLDQSDEVNLISSSSTDFPGKLGSCSSLSGQILAAANGECTKVNSLSQCQTPLPLQPPLEPLMHHSQPIDIPQYDFSTPTSLLPSLDPNGCVPNPSYQPHSVLMRPSMPSSMAGLPDQFGSFSESFNYPLPLVGHESLDNLRFLSHANQMTFFSHEDQFSLNQVSLNQVTNSNGDIDSNNNIDIGNGRSTVLDPSVPSAILDEYCTLKDPESQNPSVCFIGNFVSSQDVQSQITCTSLGDSQAQTCQNISDNSGSGGASSSNLDFDENSFLQNSSWKQVVPPMRTYTKVQKTGSVGRSIDVTSFKNYNDLCSAIESMFGLEGLLIDPRGSGWKLVYMDYENDVLLVGDDPWEEFVSCVRCIRILWPSEVQQMSEGVKLLDSAMMQGVNCSV